MKDWWLRREPDINGNFSWICYKCNNIGIIPSLEFKQFANGRYPYEYLYECDCLRKKEIWEVDEKNKAKKKISSPYSDKYGDGFQFHYSENILLARPEDRGRITYHEVYQFYITDFFRRWGKDNSEGLDSSLSILEKHLKVSLQNS